VAGHALGIGHQIGKVALPQLGEAVALGTAIGRPDQPGQLVGVLLQRHAGHLTNVRRCRHQAAHLPHREQRVQPEKLLELGPHLPWRRLGDGGGRQPHGVMIRFRRYGRRVRAAAHAGATSGYGRGNDGDQGGSGAHDGLQAG
jgi:hypothetical protein